MSFSSRYKKWLKGVVYIGDQIDTTEASAKIRNGIYFQGPNVWILAFSVIIASVGLNVNSTAVIIGAMLISPLMGPIIGLGLAMGTSDTKLLTESLRNLLIMVLVSLLAASLYFLISPLNLVNPTELLARTRPTIYDVLIAFFGGLAGMLESCRKEKGTVISGVAIATALMPPLCTVGYGISIWKGSVIFGALYLFTINSIFIALATFIAVKYFRFPAVESNEQRIRLNKNAVYIILLIVIVPSILSAISVIKENNFKIHAEKVVTENKNLGKCFIYDYKATYSRKDPKLELFLAGETLTDEAKMKLYKSAEEYGITRSQIVFHEDATSIRQEFSEKEIVKGIYEQTDKQIKALNDSISKMEATISDYKSKEIPIEAVSKELFAQYPTITEVSLSRGSSVSSTGDAVTEQLVAFITTNEPMSTELHDRIERWLKVRLKNDNIVVINQMTEIEKAAE